MMNRIGKVSIHDSQISVYEEVVDEENLKKSVMDPLIVFLRTKGWKVGRDKDVYKNFRCLNKGHRYCRKGGLEATLQLSGRSLSFEIYQNVVNVENRNGGKYDFNKMDRMPYLLRRHAEVAHKQIINFLLSQFGYELKTGKGIKGPGALTALEWVQHETKDCWHYKEELGRRSWSSDRNRTSGDNQLIDHLQPVFFEDYEGRIRTGTAFYNINNMWWVISGKYDLYNVSSRSIYVESPGDLKRKRNDRKRRNRLESLLSNAVSRMDFARAAQLKEILFGSDELYRIKKGDSYFRPCYSGYTNDPNRAGKYSKAELDKSGYMPEVERGDLLIEKVAA